MSRDEIPPAAGVRAEQEAAVARHTRRLVGAAVLRRIRGLLEERDREEHLLRTRVVPIAAALALAAAAAIWFANAAGLFG